MRQREFVGLDHVAAEMPRMVNAGCSLAAAGIAVRVPCGLVRFVQQGVKPWMSLLGKPGQASRGHPRATNTSCS